MKTSPSPHRSPRHPSVSDPVFHPQARTYGVVTEEKNGTVTITWKDGQEDVVTYAQFSVAFEWLLNRWELI